MQRLRAGPQMLPGLRSPPQTSSLDTSRGSKDEPGQADSCPRPAPSRQLLSPRRVTVVYAPLQRAVDRGELCVAGRSLKGRRLLARARGLRSCEAGADVEEQAGVGGLPERERAVG